MISLINYDSRLRSKWGRDEIYTDAMYYVTMYFRFFFKVSQMSCGSGSASHCFFNLPVRRVRLKLGDVEANHPHLGLGLPRWSDSDRWAPKFPGETWMKLGWTLKNWKKLGEHWEKSGKQSVIQQLTSKNPESISRLYRSLAVYLVAHPT